MKKTFKLQDLECANCAAKMEETIAKMDGVQDVRVNFMSESMVLEAEDDRFEEVLANAKKAIKKIEPDVRVC